MPRLSGTGRPSFAGRERRGSESSGEGGGARTRRLSIAIDDLWRKASPFARREQYTTENERDLQSKKAHLILGRSARGRYRYETQGKAQ